MLRPPVLCVKVAQEPQGTRKRGRDTMTTEAHNISQTPVKLASPGFCFLMILRNSDSLYGEMAHLLDLNNISIFILRTISGQAKTQERM